MLNEYAWATPVTFADNFDDGNADGWIFVTGDDRSGDPALNWSVVDGRLFENSGWDSQFALVENLSLTNQTIEVQVQVIASSGIALWYEDLNNYVAIGSYPSGAAIYVSERFNGTNYSSSYSYAGTQSIFFDFRVDANSTTGEINFFVGNEYVFSHTVENSLRTGLSGVVGGNGGGYLNNFVVNYDNGIAPEPKTPVPEPATLLLMCTGLVGLIGAGKKKKS